MLSIGTQFSNLYTAVDTPARGRVGVCVVFMPPRPAADAALIHTGSSAALHPTLLPFHGPIPFTFLPRPDLHYTHLL